MALARFEAVRRSAHVAIRFVPQPEGYWLQTYVDGNRQWRAHEQTSRLGVDRPITAGERLDYHFSGSRVRYSAECDRHRSGSVQHEADPIQIGSSTLLSFSPMGSSTSGTLFIHGLRGHQFAVRVLGATGRTRILEFNFGHCDMAGAVGHERRASARVLARSIEGMERARLRPGRTAHIVDLSSGGALIETDWRLLPGTHVEMQVGDPVPLLLCRWPHPPLSGRATRSRAHSISRRADVRKAGSLRGSTDPTGRVRHMKTGSAVEIVRREVTTRSAWRMSEREWEHGARR